MTSHSLSSLLLFSCNFLANAILRKRTYEDLFGHRVQTGWECGGCKYRGAPPPQWESMLEINITNAGRNLHIDQYIKRHFEGEIVEAKCSEPGCAAGGKYQKRRNKRTFLAGPEILLLELGRFEADLYGRVKKVKGHVGYDMTLDLTEYQATAKARREDKLLYKLVSVVFHGGELKGGHYKGVFTCPDGVMYVNDGSAQRASDRDLLQAPKDFQAYLLVYVRV